MSTLQLHEFETREKHCGIFGAYTYIGLINSVFYRVNCVSVTRESGGFKNFSQGVP